MRGRSVEEAQSPQPEGWALSLLAEMLKVGPPLLSEIIECLREIKSIEKFINLVVMLLPEYEAEIMSAPRNRRVYKFCFYFGKKYYPLPANTDCPPSEWTDGMPVELMGMSYSGYHNLGMRPGYLMLLSLVIYPYEGDERDMEDDSVPFNPEYSSAGKYKPSASDIRWLKELIESLATGGEWIAPMGFRITKSSDREIELKQAIDNENVKETIARTLLIANKLGIIAKFKTTGRTAEEKLSAARIPILDLVQGMVGEDIVKQIPAAGWHPDDLHQMTDKTKFDGVGDFADWVCSNTGCVLLDTSCENCEYIEGNNEPIFKWTKRNVDILTQEWPRVQEIRGKIDRVVEWLESDRQNHFIELVNFLVSHPVETERVGRRAYDPMEHLCDLDQDIGEEENDDDND
ncbi:MAG: hypothetical protein PHN78_05105 [Dehalococcoidales bacterium]|nr:hypothetical protein [Dehalococcoidales bacterium]